MRQPCQLPRIMFEDECVWWHLPLLAVAAISLAVAAGLVATRYGRRHKAREAREAGGATGVSGLEGVRV